MGAWKTPEPCVALPGPRPTEQSSTDVQDGAQDATAADPEPYQPEPLSEVLARVWVIEPEESE